MSMRWSPFSPPQRPHWWLPDIRSSCGTWTGSCGGGTGSAESEGCRGGIAGPAGAGTSMEWPGPRWRPLPLLTGSSSGEPAERDH